MFGDEVEGIVEFDPLTGKKTADLPGVRVYANSHYVTPRPTLRQAVELDQERSSRSGSTGWSRRASCSRPSGWSSAPPSTWR